MEDRDKASLPVRIITPFVLILMATGSIVWFFANAYDTSTQLVSNAVIITFNKGIFYMLGVGMGLATLAFVLVQEYWLDKPLNTKLTKICTKLAITSVAVMLALPQLAHFVTNSHLTNKEYTVCESASHQWLLARRIVYTRNMDTCDQE